MVRLDRLVNVLGRYGVRFFPSSASRDSELRSVVVHDDTDPRLTSGDVYIAVGVEPVARAVELAAAAHSVVVLVRGQGNATDGPDADSAALAQRYGVAILALESEVSWSQITGVVYGLILEGRETESGRGPTDLFALADSIADAVGGPVTIEDQMSRVLAYSDLQQGSERARLETILGRRVPDDVRALFERQGVFAHLAASDEPFYVDGDPSLGLTGRMVVAVRAGRQVLGSVWVECSGPITGDRYQALVDGSRAVALHLLRSRASADLERQIESDLVIRLLEGTADTAVASQLGLQHTPARVIAMQAHVLQERHAALLLTFERATTGFGWSRPNRSALIGNTLYTIFAGDSLPAARAWIDDLRGSLPEHAEVTAGIGGVASVAELPASRQEADECLALHATRPKGSPPVAYDESWDDILLQRLRVVAQAGRRPERGPIGDLRVYDAENGTHLVATLRAWLETGGDLPGTAKQLGVHPNTVRNRLRKMAEVTTLELNDPRKRRAMIIALAVDGD